MIALCGHVNMCKDCLEHWFQSHRDIRGDYGYDSDDSDSDSDDNHHAPCPSCRQTIEALIPLGMAMNYTVDHDMNAYFHLTPSTWIQWADLTVTIDTWASPDTAFLATTAWISLSWVTPLPTPAFDSSTWDDLYIVNDPTTPYLKVTDLNDILPTRYIGESVVQVLKLWLWYWVKNCLRILM